VTLFFGAMDRIDDGFEIDEHDDGVGDNGDDALRHVDDIDLDHVRLCCFRQILPAVGVVSITFN